MSHYLVNGTIVSGNDPYFPLSSRAYRYGDGLFETMRLHDGKVLFWQWHFLRIQKGCKLLKIHFPDEWTLESLQQQILHLAAAANSTNARIRLTVLRESEGNYTPDGQQSHLVIECHPEADKPFEWHEKGLHLGIYRELSKNHNYLSSMKSNSALIYVMAGIYAKDNGLDECVIFNEYGRVAECVSSNIFVVSGNRVITPPVSEYCIDGVMRKQVMNLALAYGYELIQTPLEESDLLSADEIFLTNAANGIRWVSEMKTFRFRNDVTKVLHQQLLSSI